MKTKFILLFAILLLQFNVFSEQRQLQVSPKKQVEPTQTYKILKKYNLTTQEYPGESEDCKYWPNQVKDVLNINDGSQKMAFYYFVVDDGNDCYLKKVRHWFSNTDVAYPGWGSDLPEEIKITNSVKEVLSAYKDNVLRYAVMLITLEDSGALPEQFRGYSILLEYNGTSELFGVPLETKKFNLGKAETLEGEVSDAIISSYPNFKWYIETF